MIDNENQHGFMYSARILESRLLFHSHFIWHPNCGP